MSLMQAAFARQNAINAAPVTGPATQAVPAVRANQRALLQQYGRFTG